jgi:hypothetical protein
MSFAASTIPYFTTLTKATAYTFAIEWEVLYVEQTYDGSNRGEFKLQVKYYANGAWRMQETTQFYVYTDDVEEELDPNKSFTLDYDLENYDDLIFRVVEVDIFLDKDDQIIKPMEYNTGSRINDGDWDCYFLIYNPASWYSQYYDEENSTGDWFEVKIVNLDY